MDSSGTTQAAFQYLSRACPQLPERRCALRKSALRAQNRAPVGALVNVLPDADGDLLDLTGLPLARCGRRRFEGTAGIHERRRTIAECCAEIAGSARAFEARIGIDLCSWQRGRHGADKQLYIGTGEIAPVKRSAKSGNCEVAYRPMPRPTRPLACTSSKFAMTGSVAAPPTP
jgi:hypothetical protein